MINFIAIKTYFNNNGNSCLEICGFGKCDNLEEERKEYQSDVDILEISNYDYELITKGHNQMWNEDTKIY